MTVDAAARLSAAWVLLSAVLAMRGGRESLRRFGMALAANAAALALFAMIQMLSWNGKIYWTRPVATPGNGGPFICHSHLAAYLNLGLGFALVELSLPSLSRSSAWQGRRLAAAYAAGLIGAGVLASLSRSGLAGMTVASVVTFGVLRPLPRGAKAWGGLAGVLALGAVFVASVGASVVYERILTFGHADAYADRLWTWAGALRAWSDHPAWGLGLGGFALTASRYYGDRDGNYFVGHAESDYIETLAEGGVVGLALTLAALAAVIGLGRRALAGAADDRQRAPILSALFGIVAVSVQGLSDFPMRVPAVAVTVVALASHLTRVGLAARRPGAGPGPGARADRVVGWAQTAVSALAATAALVLALIVAGHGLGMARSEAVLAAGGVTPLGAIRPSAALRKLSGPVLARLEEHLRRALRHRPDSAEAHARLGLMLVSHYRVAALEEIGGQVADPATWEAMADPLRMQEVAHSASAPALDGPGGLRTLGPVARYLVPAALSFLEARRCCPVWDLPHAELAALDFLIPGGERAPTHARRALALTGGDPSVLGLAATASAQAGGLDVAAACWQKMLRVSPAGWESVADRAAATLPPDQILARVVPDGRFALQFADRLYATDAAKSSRESFLKAALERLPRDLSLTESERLGYEARVLSRLGRARDAEARMAAALALEPTRAEWRAELVGWLIDRGQFEEAHQVALVGVQLAPGDPRAREAVERSVEALSRGLPRAKNSGPR